MGEILKFVTVSCDANGLIPWALITIRSIPVGCLIEVFFDEFTGANLEIKYYCVDTAVYSTCSKYLVALFLCRKRELL